MSKRRYFRFGLKDGAVEHLVIASEFMSNQGSEVAGWDE